jgi:hypothetical protein
MKKSILVIEYNIRTGKDVKTYLYHGITRKQGIINYIMQEKHNNFNTWEYPTSLDGIIKSNFIKDRILYQYNDNTIIYSQYA